MSLSILCRDSRPIQNNCITRRNTATYRTYGLHGSGPYQLMEICKTYLYGTRPKLCCEVLIHYNLDSTIFSTSAAPLTINTNCVTEIGGKSGSHFWTLEYNQNWNTTREMWLPGEHWKMSNECHWYWISIAWVYKMYYSVISTRAAKVVFLVFF